MRRNYNVIIFCALLITNLIGYGQTTTINYDNASNWTAGSAAITSYASNHTYISDNWTFTGGPALRNTNTVQDGFPGALGTYAWRLENATNVSWTSTWNLGGTISAFGFDVRRWDNSPSPNFSITYSIDGGSSFLPTGITINNAYLDNLSSWKTFSFTLPMPVTSAVNQFVVKVQALGTTERIMIDNFSFTTPPPCSSPMTPPSGFSTSNITSNGMDVNWSSIGDANNVLVVARAGAPVIFTPTSGVTYSANAAYGSGQNLGNQTYVVYNGNASGVAISSLAAGIEYHYAIFGYLNTGTCYNTSALTGNAQTTCTATNISALSGNCGNSIAAPSWTHASCFDEYLVVAKQGSSISGTPTGDGSAYTSNLNYGVGDAFDGGFIVYKGPLNNTGGNITGLTNGQTYYFKVYTRFGTTWSSGVETNCTPTMVSMTTDFFRSNTASGNWNDASSWESSSDGSTWGPSTLVPTSTSSGVTIRNGNTLIINTSVNIDQLLIESGGLLNASAGSLTVNDGAGTDLTVFGTLRSSISISISGTIVFESGGVYEHNFATGSGVIPTATWNSGSTCRIIGYTSNSNPPGGVTQSFYNFEWNCPLQTGNINFSGNFTTVNGNLDVLNTNSGTLRLSGNSSFSLNIGGNLTVQNSTFVLTSGSGIATISIGGNINIQSNGILTETSSGSGNITLNGSVLQTFNVAGTIENTINFLINNLSGVQLLSNLNLPNNLTLTSGPLILTDFNLRVSNSVLGGSSSSFIQTNGAGEFIRVVGTSPVDFQIGNSSYNPVTLNRSSGSSELGAKVLDGVFSDGLFGTPVTNNVVNRTWDITGNLVASTLTISVQWNGSEELGTFARGSSYISHYESSWVGEDPSAATGGDPYIQTRSGIGSLSPFAVGSSGALPVTLLTFTTTTSALDQKLSWTYESPEAFDYFELEHSRDGRNFSTLDRIKEGELTSRAYKADYTHVRPGIGLHYYRLKMVDLDGSYAYSQVIQGRIEGSGKVRPLSTFITAQGFDMQINESIESLEYRLVDHLGRTVLFNTQSASAGILHIPVNNLNSGLYFLQIHVNGQSEVFRMIR